MNTPRDLNSGEVAMMIFMGLLVFVIVIIPALQMFGDDEDAKP